MILHRPGRYVDDARPTVNKERAGMDDQEEPMRDERFRAVHRGGPLDLERHRLLAIWAAACAEHVLPLWEEAYSGDNRPRYAVEAARAWVRGEVRVGAARQAAVAAHTAARGATTPAAQAAARAAGHAAATAHMADHARSAARYACKAVEVSSTAPDAGAAERAWQHEHLPDTIRSLILEPA